MRYVFRCPFCEAKVTVNKEGETLAIKHSGHLCYEYQSAKSGAEYLKECNNYKLFKESC